jgi:hypothetical protein
MDIELTKKQLDRQLAREMSYYTTALLQLRPLDVKAKQGDEYLTSAEMDIRKATSDDEFNVPQPLIIYLNEIGTYWDKMGKETRLHVPPLPTAVVQHFGGYHAAEINVDTHNLFKEVPSLGITGDMDMVLASPEAEPLPNFHVRIPENAVITNNLLGRFSPTGPRRPEIMQRLAGHGITSHAFDKYVPNTRFNLGYS